MMAKQRPDAIDSFLVVSVNSLQFYQSVSAGTIFREILQICRIYDELTTSEVMHSLHMVLASIKVHNT